MRDVTPLLGEIDRDLTPCATMRDGYEGTCSAPLRATMRTRSDTQMTAAPASNSHPEADLLQCGREVGPWRIERLIGAGGMGDVYAVVHKDILKRAALKVMHRRLTNSLHAERVQLEGQVVNRVQHPNIVDIFDSGTVDDRPYLVMQRLEGVPLAHLASAGRLTPGLVIEILMQLCDALAAAHAAGIVHRDLKPDNIFLVNTSEVTPQVKLLDWGIAKVLDDGERRTMEGQLIGTPDYLSPEQACGKAISPSTDVYALGVIAYKLFLGCLPFTATSAQDMLTMHVREPPLRPVLLWREIPARLENVLLTMLAKDPKLRPTVDQVRRQLRQVGAMLCHTAVPVEVDEAHCTTRRAVIGWAPRTRLFALGVVILAAITSSSVPGGVEADLVPVEVPAGEPIEMPVHIVAPPPPTQPPATQAEQSQPPATPVEQSPPAVPATEEQTPPRPARAGKLRPPARPTRRHHRARAAVPVVVAPPEPARAEPPSSSALVERYVSIGRELAAKRRLIDASDLWTRYRLLRIYDALRTQEQRDHADAVLTGIEREISKRVAIAQTGP
jgi:serine/threonine-protein kinase